MMLLLAFFARSPRLWMRMPQATEQKVQVLRVSVVAVSLNGRTEAARASPAKPKPRAPMLDAARPAPVSLISPRRVRTIAIHSRKSCTLGPRDDGRPNARGTESE